jgi:hypothetical protein
VTSLPIESSPSRSRPTSLDPTQAEANTAAADLPDLPEELLVRLRRHAWNRAFWYAGK